MDGIPDLVLKGEKDEIFSHKSYPNPFDFNKQVAHVFDDMITRSVPLYHDVANYLGSWVSQYYQAGTQIYDIGCSTGTTTMHLAQRLEKPVTFVGIDNSPSMIQKAQEKLNAAPTQHQYELICSDALDVTFNQACFVVVNYTLQFIPVNERIPLLKNIFDGLLPGGILFISEKIRFNSNYFQNTCTDIYESFKEDQGYSKEEIYNKKEALDKVLQPFTEEQLKDSLSEAGFTHVESVIKWNNFMSLIAIKDYVWWDPQMPGFKS